MLIKCATCICCNAMASLLISRAAAADNSLPVSVHEITRLNKHAQATPVIHAPLDTDC